MNIDEKNEKDSVQDEYEQYYGSFPYKSYEEIVTKKRRKHIFRKAAAVFSILLGVFVLCITIGLLWSGKALTMFTLENESDMEQNSNLLDKPSSAKDDFSLKVTEPSADASQVIMVKDVTAVVEKAKKSVVGVRTESYSNLTIMSSGSGIILTNDGYVVTNQHVVSGGDNITVTLDNGKSYAAYVIGSDEYSDIAVLKIEAKNLDCAEFGNSDDVKIGQAAIVIGNPTGQLQGTVTGGLISAVNRDVVVDNNVMTLIQTDASINRGNSGGPLLNEYGQVVGITSLKIKFDGYEGLGFAIPINSVKPLIEEIINTGYVSGRPFLGIEGRELSQMAAAFYSVPRGIYISSVAKGSSAEKVGLVSGDIIVSVDGERVYNLSTACVLRNGHKVGEHVVLTFYRQGSIYEATVTLMEQSEMLGDFNF